MVQAAVRYGKRHQTKPPNFHIFNEEIGNPGPLWWQKGPNQQQIAKTDVERGFKNQPPVAARTQVAVVDSEGKASSYVGKVIQGQVKGADSQILSHN